MRHTSFLVGLLLLFLANPAFGVYMTATGFTQDSVTPTDFQNSTVLSVAASPTGDIVASKGFNIASVPFDGSPSSSRDLPFAGSHYLTEGMRFSPGGTLHLLQLNYDGAGDVRLVTDSGYPEFVQFDSNQQYSRSLAFAGDGDLLVTGTYGSVGEPGWLRMFDSSGSSLLNKDVTTSPVASSHDSSDLAHYATHSGQVYSVTESGTSTFVSQVPSEFVGAGVGYIESFALDSNDNMFLGVNLGQKFLANSSAIVRLSASGDTDVLAYGTRDIPVDMAFGPANDLFVASFNPYTSSKVFRFSGDFGGPIEESEPYIIPEPNPGALLLLSAVAIVLARRVRSRSTELSRAAER